MSILLLNGDKGELIDYSNICDHPFCCTVNQVLAEAKEYAGKNGYIASCPQLIGGRINTEMFGPNSEGWGYFVPFSEEDAGKTPQGNPVVLITHGAGILLSPEGRIQKALNGGLTNNGYYARLSSEEWNNALKGKMPDGTEIPIYSLKEFLGLSKDKIPRAYGAVMDLETAKKLPRGYYPKDKLKESEFFAVRCGSEDLKNSYLDKIVQHRSTIWNDHRFDGLNPEEPSGSLLSLCDNLSPGIGNFALEMPAGFVVVEESLLKSILDYIFRK